MNFQQLAIAAIVAAAVDLTSINLKAALYMNVGNEWMTPSPLLTVPLN